MTGLAIDTESVIDDRRQVQSGGASAKRSQP